MFTNLSKSFRLFPLLLLIPTLLSAEMVIEDRPAGEITPKKVSTSDGLYQLTLDSHYTNKMGNRRDFISARMPGLPYEHLTLLQQSPTTTVYAFSIPFSERKQPNFERLILALNEQFEDLEGVEYRITQKDTLLNNARYEVRHEVDDRKNHELCQMQLTLNSVDVFCASSERFPEALGAIIDTLQLK